MPKLQHVSDLLLAQNEPYTLIITALNYFVEEGSLFCDIRPQSRRLENIFGMFNASTGNS